MQDFEDARDRVMMGPERRSLVLSNKEKRVTAYHEAGHALVGRLLPDMDPIHKVTIIPRGPSLGLTSILPEEDRHSVTKSYCLAIVRWAMGGRAAEETVFEEFSSGASSDLKQATDRAHAMVCQWGMSKLGPISFGSNTEVFLGRDFVKERDFSEETASAVDQEIHKILTDAYVDAKSIVLEHRTVLDAIAEALVERETLEADELDTIIREHGGEDLIPARPEPTPEPVPPEEVATPKPVRPDEPELGDVAPPEILPDTV